MKNKVLIVILIVLLVILFSVLFIKYKYDKKDDVIEELGKFSSIKYVNLCKKEDNCSVIEDTYGVFEYDYDDEQLQKWIKKVNEDTEKLYQKTINSNLDDEVCSGVKEVYNYRYNNKIYFYVYTGDKYISIGVERVKIDLCTNETINEPIETFIYNKVEKKRITQEELMAELNLDNNKIQDSIKRSIKELNEMDVNSNLTIEDNYTNYKLFFDYDGTLLAYYYQNSNKSYYSAIVNY